ncbi:hypothetical protein N9407_02450 [Candidatus Pelagibacter sp.]|nr:hypothetical protein [Candidatus Pelagibacter sp.]
MLKKNIIILSLILFLGNCGFTPIYLNNSNIDFSIEQVDYIGDKDFNNYLKINLDRYRNKQNNKKIFIQVETKYEKNVLSKDNTGKIIGYQLIVETIFLIKSTNKKIIITEKKTIDTMDDKFEETRYEKSIKQSFAYAISNKLISELITN